MKSASIDKEEAAPPSPAKNNEKRSVRNASPEKNEKPKTVAVTKTPVSEVIKVRTSKKKLVKSNINQFQEIFVNIFHKNFFC